MRQLGVAALSCALLALASPAFAEKDAVAGLVDELKPTPLDWAVWSERILKFAGTLKDDPAARTALFRKAYEYGIRHRNGYSTAIEAARNVLQSAAEPKEKLAWLRKLVDAHKLAFRAAAPKGRTAAGTKLVDQQIALADALAETGEAEEALRGYATARAMARTYARNRENEIAGKIKDLTARRKVFQDIERCKKLLARDPADVAARQKLIRLYLVELDSPADAEKLLTADVDETWRTYVPFVRKAVAKLSSEALVEQMGDWCKHVLAAGEGATPRGKARALTRARSYYERFLELHPKQDLTHMRVRAKLAKLDSLLARLLPRSLPKRSDWDRREAGPWEERPEGLRLYGAAHRKGNRMTTKACYDLTKASVFVKWNPHGHRQYAGFLCGVDGAFSAACPVHHQFRDPVLPEDAWYYTRIALNRDKSYVILTCSGNYDTKGGAVVMKHKGAVSEKAWRLAKTARIFVSIGDNYAGQKAYVTVAETYAREVRRK